MDIKDFKAGVWKSGYQYKYFQPMEINHDFVWQDGIMNELLERASLTLGTINTYSRLIPDVDLYIKMHVSKEALLSSKIEGTQTNMQEALMNKKDVAPERRDDWEEVNNYVLAMNQSIEELKELPLSNRLIRNAHNTLMAGVRGQHKKPGDFRTSQNWIGGVSIADATFIPPIQDEVENLMSDFEKFLNNEELHIPHLIRIAIAHYQFETIHPFLDGNGRLGRLLITLYLVRYGVIDKPLFYISEFFEKHRNLYYDNLMIVRQKNDLRRWLLFFLNAIIDTSNNAANCLQKILKLKEIIFHDKISQLGARTKLGGEIIRLFFSSPIMTADTVVMKTGKSPKTIYSILNKFHDDKILKEITGLQRGKIFVFEEYINLFR